MPRPDWFPDWSDRACALVGAGSSATQAAVDALRGRCRVMVINTSYQRAPWADALYACDGRWWNWHRDAAQFEGLKITQDVDAAKRYGLHRIDLLPQSDPQPHRIVMDLPGTVGRGDNSGFHGLNLLAQFWVKQMILLGIDFQGERWHGRHPNGSDGQKPDTLKRFRELFDAQAGALRALRIDVVNVSAVSALTAFPKLTIEDALARFASRQAA